MSTVILANIAEGILATMRTCDMAQAEVRGESVPDTFENWVTSSLNIP
jgi:hypothetical protein